MTYTSTPPPLHVAIIMDGNGRWATARGLPRIAGHREGVKALRRVVEAAPGLGIATLTLYAFSADNWHRPAEEVQALMDLFRRHFALDRERLVVEEVRLSVIGRRDRLDRGLAATIHRAETATAAGRTLHLRIAVDYSARQAILRAARAAPAPPRFSCKAFSARLNAAMHSNPVAPDVDLLIRTGGERRLSDFLLWESANAELLFVDTLWPAFNAEALTTAVADFQGRNRRFGRVKAG